MSSGSDSGGDTGEAGSSSQIASIRHVHVNMLWFLKQNLGVVTLCAHVRSGVKHSVLSVYRLSV